MSSHEERAKQLRADGWILVPVRFQKSVRACCLPRVSLKELSLCLAPPWVVSIVEILHDVPATAEHYSGYCLMGMTERAARTGIRDPESAAAALRLGRPRAMQNYLEGVS